jgi:hypothetical protein
MGFTINHITDLISKLTERDKEIQQNEMVLSYMQ